MRKRTRGGRASTAVTERLDALNQRSADRGNAPEQVRRQVEATIEARARRRRGRQAPASAAWKNY